MKKFSIIVNAKEYTISLESDFEEFFQDDFAKNFKSEQISTQELLSAYMSKSYELYKLKKELDALTKNIAKSCLNKQKKI